MPVSSIARASKTTESGGPRGYDAGKKIKGRKRHIVTDTEGKLVHAMIHTADIQDRDGAPLVLAQIVHRFPWLRHLFAEGGYAGDKLKDALTRIGKWTVEIIKRSDVAKGFNVLPRRGMAQSQPPPRQGLRTDHRVGNSMALHRFNPALQQAHRKTLQSLKIIMNQALRS